MKAGIIGMGMWMPDQVRTNDDWPASFVEAFHRDRETRKRQDFSVIQGNRGDRKYNDLYVKYASAYAGDPFKGAVKRRVAPFDQPANDVATTATHNSRLAIVIWLLLHVKKDPDNPAGLSPRS